MTAPLERRIKLTLHYDGAGFMGWQVQPGERTVQSELEGRLGRLLDCPVSVVAAGRTDRGVHATGQVVSALVPAKWTAEALRRSLNATLPKDVWVESAVEVPLHFHARYSATARSYVYRVGASERAYSPFYRRWCWAQRDELDGALLAMAAEVVVGEHSFKAFAKTGQPERGELCQVTASGWTEWECGVAYQITANRFLHHMVRYLVGTMVEIARRRRPLADLAQLLSGTRGLETSAPAPPEGLFLSAVHYPPEMDRVEDRSE